METISRPKKILQYKKSFIYYSSIYQDLQATKGYYLRSGGVTDQYPYPQEICYLERILQD